MNQFQPHMLTFTMRHKIFHQDTNLSIKLPHVTRPALFIIVIPCNKTCYLCLGDDSIEKKKICEGSNRWVFGLGDSKKHPEHPSNQKETD